MIRASGSDARRSRFSRRHVLAATAAAGALTTTCGPLTALARISAATPRSTPAGPWHDPSAIPTTGVANATSRFQAVAGALKAVMVANGVPGAALGILMDGQEEHAVFGVANLATKAPVTPATLFQIGSLTKTYTGTAAMRLIAQGKLDLYAPVRTYLPDLDLQDESVAARVTVHHLLTHSAGW